MAGIYGNLLMSFPELFVTVKFWRSKPDTTGAWGAAYDIAEYRVIVLDDRGDSLIGHSGRLTTRSKWRAVDRENNDVLYATHDVPIEVGMFLEHPYQKGEVCRLMSKLDHGNTGGFSKFSISRVTGETSETTGRLDIAIGKY